MLAQHVSNVQLANRIGLTRQEINRVTDLRHSTKIDTIAKALNSLGKHLQLEVA
jgi:antitoxin HicB